jgi:hypothetical protein
MSYDERALQAKKIELTAVAEHAVDKHTTNGASVANLVVQAFAKLSPPENPEVYAELIVLSVARRPTGESRKAGNIYLNWKKLVDIVPDAALAAAGGAAGPPWLLVLAGLYIWNKLWRGAQEKLTDIEATIILALWRNRNAENKISEDEGYEKTNVLRREFELPELSKASYQEAINRLLKIDCIELDEGWLWLREWVRVAYS